MPGPVGNYGGGGWHSTQWTNGSQSSWQPQRPSVSSGSPDQYARLERSGSTPSGGTQGGQGWGDGGSWAHGESQDLASQYHDTTGYQGGTTSGSQGGTTSGSQGSSAAGYQSSSTTNSQGSASTSGAIGATGLGVQIDYQNGGSIAAYEKATGVKPASVGNFISVGNGTVDMTDAEKTIDDAAANGVGTVQLSVRSGETGALSAQEVSQFQQLAQDAKAKGVTLQVRYGYEMNDQSVSGFSNPATFQQQWAQVAAAVQPAGGKMIWCVAQNSDPSTYNAWIPKDPSTVDGVGVDVYNFGSGAIDSNDIKAALSGVANLPGLAGKPLTIPETGVNLDGSGDDASKVSQWLSMLSDPSLKAEFPTYTGFDWFDYNKPGDIDSSLSDNSAYAQALQQWAAGSS